jgi:hypothetical protein
MEASNVIIVCEEFVPQCFNTSQQVYHRWNPSGKSMLNFQCNLLVPDTFCIGHQCNLDTTLQISDNRRTVAREVAAVLATLLRFRHRMNSNSAPLDTSVYKTLAARTPGNTPVACFWLSAMSGST